MECTGAEMIDRYTVHAGDMFFQPTNVAAIDLTGTQVQKNFLPDWEAALGMKAGSLTPEIWQAITMIHETGHALNTLFDDERTNGGPALSHQYTQKVVDHCFNNLKK
jgi:hypothetical protein